MELGPSDPSALAYNVDHYPPDKLPEVSKEAWKEMVTKDIRSPAEISTVEREAHRALEKLYWARGRPDEDARFCSATATAEVAIRVLGVEGVVGAATREGGSTGGRRKANNQRQGLQERNDAIIRFATSCQQYGYGAQVTIRFLQSRKPALVQDLGDRQLRRILSRVFPARKSRARL